MHNSWLQFLIPKIQIQVDSLADVRRLREQNVKIYRVKPSSDGYIITVRSGKNHDGATVGRQSIYGVLAKFILPVAFIWAMLLVAFEFITIDYEIHGNLPHEEMVMVDELIAPYFVRVGGFSFFNGSEERLIETVSNAFHDYLWIDVQTTGSRLVVNIYNTQVTDESGIMMPPVDTLYATATGVVTEINAGSCRVLVEIDQVVYLGDPLITCYTPTGFGTDVAPIEGIAQGSVYALVWYEVKIEFPREYGKQMVTGSSHSNLFLNFGDQRLRIWGPDVAFLAYDERNQVFNPLDFFNIAPITLERVHYYEKSDIILTNEVERIRVQADDLVKNQLSADIEREFELIDLQFLTLDEIADMVILTYHATVREDIAN